MYPALFSLGGLSISSFGLFLALAFLTSTFICWRLAKLYDFDEERILDLAILTFLGSILGARLYFVTFNWELFQDLAKVLLINRYPGLSFWGGLLGGMITLIIFTKRFKLHFWQIADFAATGFILGLAFGDMGCFLGGCGYGNVSHSFLATPVVGLVGKRFPVSALESLVLLLAFFYLWNQVVRFHFSGKTAAFALMILGVVKYFTEFFRGDSKLISQASNVSLGHFLAATTFFLGLGIFYYRAKRSLVTDLSTIPLLFTSSKKRTLVVSQIRKSWYNQKVNLKIKISKMSEFLHYLPKVLRRRFNVRPTPTRFNQD